ncbi:MAG: STAS domain-containing protein [Terriglobia bacterium]|jgi:anti-anti-sigma factor
MEAIVKERQAGSVTILELSGRLHIGAVVEELDQKLQRLVAEGRTALLLDCSQVAGIDSQGIKTLVRGVISAQRRGGKLKLLKLTPRVREVLSITRLLTVIESFDDEQAALSSFSAQAGVGASETGN